MLFLLVLATSIGLIVATLVSADDQAPLLVGRW
jgi:hypothetical protein